MEYRISNDVLTVAVSSLGGGLTHLIKGGAEYLWQGDPAFWSGQAPQLFPIVGRLTDGRCTMDGETCRMNGHGFFRRREMELLEEGRDHITLAQCYDENTLEQYPRKWRVALTYALAGATLTVRFQVENLDEKRLWFYYGGHPGFQMPLEEGLDFCDYYVRFAAGQPVQLLLSDDCFLSGEEAPLALTDGLLRLRHGLFDHDALVLRNTGGALTLFSPKGSRSVTLRHEQLPYLGLWHTPKTRAPFVCLEPWMAPPARQDMVEELAEKPGTLSLEPGARHEITWSITLDEG